jgi:hypothetical protein
MKNHYILLWIEKPAPAENHKLSEWHELLPILETLVKNAKGVETLGSNVWLLPRDTGLYFLTDCVGRARAKNLICRTKYLDDES